MLSLEKAPIELCSNQHLVINFLIHGKFFNRVFRIHTIFHFIPIWDEVGLVNFILFYCLWSLKSIKLLKKFKNWKYPSDPSCFPHTSNKCYFLGGFTKKVNRKVANEFMLEFSDLAWILFRSLNIPIFIGLIWVLEWCM